MPRIENTLTDWVAVPRTEPDEDYTPRPAGAYSDLTEAEFLRGDE